MLARFAGLVEDPMAHIACFKEIVSGPVCDLLWGMIHLTDCHLPYSTTDVVVIANVSAASNRYLRHAQFVFGVEFGKVSSINRRLV